MDAEKEVTEDLRLKWHLEMEYVQRVVAIRFDQLERKICTMAKLVDHYKRTVIILEQKCKSLKVPSQDADTQTDFGAEGDSPKVSIQDDDNQIDFGAKGDSPMVSIQDAETQTEFEAKGDSLTVSVQNEALPHLEASDHAVQTDRIKSKTRGCSTSLALQDAHTQTESCYHQIKAPRIPNDTYVPTSSILTLPYGVPAAYIPRDIEPNMPISEIRNILSAPKPEEMPKKQQGLRVPKDYKPEPRPVMPKRNQVLNVPKNPNAEAGLPEDQNVLNVPNAMELPVSLDVQGLPEGPAMVELPEDVPNEPNAMEFPVPLDEQELSEELIMVGLPEDQEQLNVLNVPTEPNAMELPVPLDEQELSEELIMVEFAEDQELRNVLNVPEEPNALELPVSPDVQELPEGSTMVDVPKKEEPLRVHVKPNVMQEPVVPNQPE